MKRRFALFLAMLTALALAVPSVPGAHGAPLVGVSATGFAPGLELAHQWGPDDLVDAWR